MMPIHFFKQNRLALNVLVTLLFAFQAASALAIQDSRALSKENKLKATYLLNFTKYIQWPVANSLERSSPIHICLQDGTRFEGFLKELTANQVVGAGKQRVEVYSIERAQRCDLTYLHSPLSQPNARVASSVAVLDSSRVDYERPAITFYIEKRRLRFEVSVRRTKELQVIVSSELLKLARLR